MLDLAIVLKDYMVLKKGDLIEFNHNYNTVYLVVHNRQRDEEFWGNEKGEWGASNPCPKRIDGLHIPGVHFMWVKKTLLPFTAMEFKLPEHPKDLTKHLRRVDYGKPYHQVYIDQIKSALQSAGVID